MEPEIERFMNGNGIPIVRELAASLGAQGWVVGGCLRDLLLGREVNDIDIALAGGWRELPRDFAQKAGGSFFWLDEERGHSRVVVREGEGRVTVDFAPLKGGDIVADLALRDFTINALALPLGGDDGLIDPLHGRADLESRVVRVCSPTSFADDPLRLVRAFRFAAILGFRIDPNTKALIPRHTPRIVAVAGERLRDELFRILGTSVCGPYLRDMAEAGLLDASFPGAFPAPLAGESRAAAVAAVERVEETAEELPSLGDAAPETARVLRRELQEGITVLSLMKLAAFVTVCRGEPAAVAGRLRLGRMAERLVELLCEPDGLSAGAAPCVRDFFRLFSDRDPAGPELPLLALALGRITEKRCKDLIDFYSRSYVPRGRPLLLTGDEIMALLGIPPGRRVGEALEALREAQSAGLVATAEEARAFLPKKLLTTNESIR